jgi:hypothetical protein
MTDAPLVVDPIGKVIILMREFLEANGDLTDSGSLDFTDTVIRGTEKEKDDEPPFIVVDRGPVSDFPFGEGSGRMGLADHSFIVRVYGRKRVSGEREAARLANLIRQALHNHPPIVMGNVAIHRIRVLSTGPPLTDPVEDIPYVPMNIGLYASALAVAS